MSNSLSGLKLLLLPEFIDMVSILYYNYIEFIITLYWFLVIFFSWNKGYITSRIWFSKFGDVSPAFACWRVIGN